MILETINYPLHDFNLRRGNYGDITLSIEKPDIKVGDEFSIGLAHCIVTKISQVTGAWASIVAAAKSRSDYEEIIAASSR